MSTPIKMFFLLLILCALSSLYQNCARATQGHDGSLQDNGGTTFSDGFGPCFQGELCNFPPQSTTCFDPAKYYELVKGVFCLRQPTTTTTVRTQ